jgi:hypothetical protein
VRKLLEGQGHLQISRPIASQSEKNRENSCSAPLQGIRRAVFAQPRSRAVGRPRDSWSRGPIGGDAYAGVSSTMRPSLQPYLASKSAFTVAPS